MPPTSDVVINEVIAVHSLPSHYKDWQEAGINLQTSDIFLARQPRLAGIKHCNRLEQVLVKSATLTQGYDDWLVLDSQRNMIESSMANLFFDIEGQIIIPLQSYAGVAGMMREQIIYQLLEMDYSVGVDELSVENLHKVRHVFMTNSLLGIVDVDRVDHHCFTKAPYTRLIRQRLKLTL